MIKPWIESVFDDASIVRCVECKKLYTITVKKDQVIAWQAGQFIQDAMPELPRDVRELFISGMCSSCWDKLFGTGE